MERAVAEVRRQGGVARTSTLRDVGVTRRELAVAVRHGTLLRVRKGVYGLPRISSAIREAVNHCGAIACVTAARDHGLWTLDDAKDHRVHTWVHPDRRTTRVAIAPHPDDDQCCVFHRDRPLDQPELGRVGILHCLLQVLRCRGEETFFAALESAMRQGLVGRKQRARLRSAVPSESRWLVDFARADADSGLESLLRLRLHRLGLAVQSQVRIPGVGRVDFVIGDCLILEADGETHELSRHEDRVRDAAAAALGFSTLRFDYATIIHDWPLVESAVRMAVSRGLHRSSAGLTW